MSEISVKGPDHLGLFNRFLTEMFEDIMDIVRSDPKLAYFLAKTIRNQRRALKLRGVWERKGVNVPPFLIMSITGDCNLRCHGCYAKQWRDADEPKLGEERISGLFDEAEELGVSIILLAGGEPLLRRSVLELAALHPRIVFPVFTNGLLLDEGVVALFRKHRNLVPVISLEGHQSETDERRGGGTFKGVRRGFEMLRDAGVFFGTSITVTSENLDLVTSDGFIRDVMGLGPRLFFFVEYVPVKEGSENLVPNEAQRAALLERTRMLRERGSGLFIAFPGDEELFGGCLSAGRGFAHINPFGHLEPCPFAPYHDCDLKETSLREGLNSRFLKEIRSNREMLSEVNGGCALWVHQDWVRSLIQAG